MGRQTDIRAELAALGITPKKAFGQNFLFDPNGIGSVMKFAATSPSDCICEVGPGLGALSRLLAEGSRQFFAIEIEEGFANRLKRELSDLPNVEVCCADVRKVRLAELLPDERRWTVVSNVPYSISSDVILWLIEQSDRIASASLLLQREFAERVAAAPGGKEYGSLSVQSQLLADVRLGPRIGGKSFYPATDVDSRLVRFDFLEAPRFPVTDREVFRKVVRAGFGQRRKTLLNALTTAEIFPTRTEIEAVLNSLGITPSRRAETLSVEEFVRIANEVKKP